jgi:ParB-like chromosome segregation protein Spo0J
MSYSKRSIIEALERTHGMIFLAAKELGCAPVTIYRHAAKDSKVQAIIDSYRGQLVDKAELKLEQAVLNGEPWALNLTLKTLGKSRGYVERQEVTGADGGPVKHTLTVRELTQGGDSD